MINFKYQQLDKGTLESIQTLANVELTITEAENFATIIEKLSVILNEKNAAEIALTNKFAKRDENNEFVRPTNEAGDVIKDGYMVDNEQISAYEEDLKVLVNTECYIDALPLNKESFNGAKISTMGLLKIKFLF